MPEVVQTQDVADAIVNPSVTDEYEIAEVTLNGIYKNSRLSEVSKLEYYAYTTRFDEVIGARDLAGEGEMLRLYGYINKVSDKEKIEKKWEVVIDDLNETMATITSPISLAVTILIDLSGSMRGRPISSVAVTVLHLMRCLDRLGIRFEVLGFTTRAWKGGQSREVWLRDGKPSNPGRLNDLRHVVFKAFDESVEAALPNLGLMAREGLLKENIDGEALLWARARLRTQAAKLKHIFVLSDGAPVDDSTLSVNPGNFLEKHLKRVIKQLPEEGVGLTAIGVGHDVSRYYPGSGLAVADLNLLGLPVLQELKRILVQR